MASWDEVVKDYEAKIATLQSTIDVDLKKLEKQTYVLSMISFVCGLVVGIIL